MYEELVDTAVAGARSGAEVLLRYFRDNALEITAKGRHDFVTRADHESEERVVAAIRRRFPDHHILAEESGQTRGYNSEYEWFVDPLDGTSNFMQGLPLFCISVACRYRDELIAGVVFDPLGENLFTAARGGGARWNGRPMRVSQRPGLGGAFLATGYPFRARRGLDLYLEVFRAVFLKARGIRRCGAAALDLAYTAAGVYDGFFEFRLSPWDLAAGVLLIREAGGVITDLDGGDAFFSSGNLIAGPAGIHAELLRTVQAFVDEAGLEAVDPMRNKHGPEIVGG
ncbi:MAG: inositol monophosphatase [bacterium]|nr:inositol monophosphatase [bacterium]